MGSTTRTVALLLSPAAVAAALLLFSGGCGGDDAVGPSASDARAEEAAVGDGAKAEADAPSDAGPPCVSTFPTRPGCVHPVVVRQCDAGWCRIPSGCFVAGSPRCQFGRGALNEEEVEVTLTHDFEIGQLEVSQRDWTALGLPNPSGIGIKGDVTDCLEADCPVGHVSWYAAAAYANRVSVSRALEECYALEGCSGTLGKTDFACTGVQLARASLYECRGYRLPTEAEWEYAARAGARTAYYLGSIQSRSVLDECSEEPALAPAAWYCFNANLTTHPGGQKVPNGWGLHDVLGNASEWMSDTYVHRRELEGPLTDPGSALGADDRHALRGGPFTGYTPSCTVTRRFGQPRGGPIGPGLGFRLARSLSFTSSAPDAGP